MANVFDNESPYVINNNVGFGGQNTPTAKIHIAGSNGLSNTAPLKFSIGTILTNPENGSVEFDGNHLYITIGGIRSQLDQQSGGGGVLILESLTTTQRNALTPTNGLLINNSTVNQFQKYENSQWVDISKSPAIKVVAPSGSGYSADYYTDGTADDVEINAAIQSANGGKVLLKGNNTYNLTNSINLNIINTVLEGEGWNTILFRSSAFNDNMVNITADNSIVKDLAIDGNRTGFIADHHGIVIQNNHDKVLHCYVKSTYHHGINCPNGTDILIDGCYVYDTGTGGGADGVGIIAGATAVNVKIVNCTTYQTGYHGIQIYNSTVDAYVDNCDISQPGLRTITGSGLKINPGCSQVYISNCHFSGISSGNSSPGILIQSDTATPTDDIKIVDCSINGFAQEGIEVEGITNLIIANNTIFNNGQNASASVNYGIRLIDGLNSAFVCNHISILGNKIYDNQISPTQGKPIGIYNGTTNLFIDNLESYGHASSNDITVDASSTGTIYYGRNFGGLTNVPNISKNNIATGSEPRVIITEGDTGANAKRWDIDVNGGTLNFRTLNDSDSQKNNIMHFTRSGANPSGIVNDVNLTLRTGTATAGQSPLKFISGTNLTTPEDGAVEYDGVHLYFTIGSTRSQLDNQSGGGVLSVSGTTNRITSTGGTTPVIDIDAGYVGQSSITTLGTINTGVWAGTAIDHSHLTGIVQSDIGGLTTASSPTFSGLNLGTGNINTVGNIEIDGTAVRDITVGRSASGVGNNLTVQAGGAAVGGGNVAGGDLLLAGGITTGNVGSNIRFYTASNGGGAGDNAPTLKMTLFNTNTFRLFLGSDSAPSNTLDGFGMNANAAKNLYMNRHTTGNTAGNNLSVIAGSATSAATNKNGGTLILKAGTSTGSGTGQVQIQTFPGTAGSTSDNTAITAINFNGNGIASTYANISTAGQGIPSIYAYNRSTAQTGAIGSLATYTLPATDGSFLVSANINITAFTAGTFNTTVTYTDETNTSRTLTLNFSSITGTLGITLAAAGAFEGIPVHIRAKASTSITVATSGTFTTLTYNAEASITQIA